MRRSVMARLDLLGARNPVASDHSESLSAVREFHFRLNADSHAAARGSDTAPWWIKALTAFRVASGKLDGVENGGRFRGNFLVLQDYDLTWA